MFKFRKKKPESVIVRTKDLQAGDQFMWNGGIVEVLDVNPGLEETNVRLGSAHPAFRCETRQIKLFNEMNCSIVRA
jgi:hypothetical protein